MLILTYLDLNKNELRNAVIQNLSSAPGTPSEGQMYYNTSDDQLYVYSNGSWVNLMSSSGLANAYATITDGTTPASASGADTFKLRSADNKLTVATQSNDGTHGDNALFTINQGNIDHNSLSNYDANRHIDHTAVSITAGTGLSGGGTIAANRTLNVDITGLTALGTTPASDDTILIYDTSTTTHKKVSYSDFISSVVGGVTYQGSWNASTNSPTITSSTGTKGHYYVVGTQGSTDINGITDWKVGDWIIYNGTVWQKIDNTDQVSSVFGRTGAVTAQNGDYTATQVSYDDTGNTYITASNVQSALADVETALSLRARKYVATGVSLGTTPGAQTITHNLNTKDVQVSIRNTSTDEIVYADVLANNLNSVSITAAGSTITTNITVIG
jgi:hypothetical protein